MDYNKFNVPSGFLREEVREDYLVSLKTKKIWAVELDLMSKLLEVCSKYDIKVYGFAGTLLGAIRHNGFIPWDDDMDVCILQEDYEKLESIAEKEFLHPYFFQTALTDRKYFFGYARLRNSETTGVIEWNKSAEYNNGIFIDIFVLNGMSNNEKAIKRQLIKRNVLHKLLNVYSNSYEKKGLKKYMVKVFNFFLTRLVSYEYLVGKYREIISQYDKKSEQLSLLTHDWNFIHKYWCSKESLQESINVNFENIKIPVPKDYHSILTHMYGNYMDFPPIEERGKWHDNMVVFEPDIPYKSFLLKDL